MNGNGKFWLAVAAGAAFLALRAVRRRRRIDFQGASVLITGGSRGLGLELARLFAAEGARLTLLARNELELRRAQRELATRGADVLVCPCDVRDPEAVRRAVQLTLDSRGRIDVLVNNAGIIQVGPMEHMDLADFQEAMAVHAWGPLHLIRAVVPQMKSQGGGRIVNISSIGGLVAVPHLLPYTMSKFALTGLSDGVRAELAKDGILVTTVAPGVMRTGSHVNTTTKGQHEKEFAWFAISAGVPLFSSSSRTAARRIVQACRYGRASLVISPQARLLHITDTLFPNSSAFLHKMAARLLPHPVGAEGNRARTGWESRSWRAPALLTAPADRAIRRNNEE